MLSHEDVSQQALEMLSAQLKQLNAQSKEWTDTNAQIAAALAIAKIAQILANIGEADGTQATTSKGDERQARKSNKETLEEVFSHDAAE